MSPLRRVTVATLIALLCASPAVARDTEEGLRAHPLWATFQGGAMLPSGDQGSGLESGYQVSGSLGLVINQTFNLEGDLGYVSSSDEFSRSIIMLALDGRLNPSPDWTQLYLRAGVGAYLIAHHVEVPGETPPPDHARPGLNFAVGYDLRSFSRVTVGFLGSYHGIVIARSDALSYVSLGAYFSLRQSE